MCAAYELSDVESCYKLTLVECTKMGKDAFMLIESVCDQAGNITDGVFVAVNDVLECIADRKNRDLAGKMVSDVWPNISSLFWFCCDQVAKTGEPRRYTSLNKMTNRWYETFCFPHTAKRLGLLFRDITDKVVTEQALARNTEMFRTFMTSCFETVYLLSADLSHVRKIKQGGVMLTDTKPKPLDPGWLDYIHQQDRAAVAAEMYRAMENKDVFKIQCRTLGHGKTIRWLDLRFIPIIGKDCDVVVWVGSSCDITLKKEYERRVLALEDQYLETTDSPFLGLLVVDYLKKEIRVSENWKHKLGLEDLSPKEIFQEPNQAVHPDDVNMVIEGKSQSLKARKSNYTLEYRVNTVDGYIWVLGQMKVIYNEAGEPIKAYGIQIDITKRKLAENALKDSRKKALELVAELRQIDTNKNSFISSLSHELRNPLAALSTGVALMDHVVPGSEQDLRARLIIKRQTSQITKLADDLLDVTRLDSNKIVLTKENIEANSIVSSVVDGVKGHFKDKGIELKANYCADKLYIKADPARIKQALENILFNSLKFTDKGTVEVAVSKEVDNKKDVNCASIIVSDTGVGITDEFLPLLFKPFVQFDKSYSQNMHGLGLGLSIGKKIIELHGGTIEAKSDGPGEGAEFTVRLPLTW